MIARVHKSLQGITTFTRVHKGLQWVARVWLSGGYKSIQWLTGDYEGIQEITRNNRGIQGLTMDCKGNIRDYKGLQGD